MKPSLFAAGILALLFLSGCWDQRILKDRNLIICIGRDLAEEGKIQNSFALLTPAIKQTSSPSSSQQPGSGAVSGKQKNVISAVGDTINQTAMMMDRKTSETVDDSKNQAVLIGEKLARLDLYSTLDLLYRDPMGELKAKVAVVKGEAKQLMEHIAARDPLVGSYLVELLESQVERRIIPEATLQSIYPSLLEHGEDLIIPYLGLVDGEPAVIGSVLTHDKKMTGTLTPDESLLSMMFSKFDLKGARINQRIGGDEKLRTLGYISFLVGNVKRKMDVKVESSSSQSIIVDLHAKLKVTVVEYPHNQLNTEAKFNELNRKLSNQLTKDAEKVLHKLQEARCDFYGVGRQIMAFHPETWKKLDWDKDFSRISFRPRVEVEIKGTGLIH
ncbi:Ger(x)C family spore germination protein [Brevibacillus choshinensis]|uniref:Ger(X)C family spore germination protein n=1 Tax=Brevibacillus choshinensis TaxID=54911 RepID=A0ABX7FRU4_BRECH|nr:Ger(x)C family spore germination protein [Brevibacillus choshinensis]QRG68352.1 Ger(x)C family spore germination protein [Brevibacillus choshinensis]